MNPLTVIVVLLGLVVLATLLGLFWRSQNGRVRTIAHGETVIVVSELLPNAVAGRGATLLQFSTEVCAPCKSTHALLHAVAERHSGVTHIDVDITHRADIAAQFTLLQSPTTFILDAGGVVRARIGGAPRPGELSAHLEHILDLSTVAA